MRVSLRSLVASLSLVGLCSLAACDSGTPTREGGETPLSQTTSDSSGTSSVSFAEGNVEADSASGNPDAASTETSRSARVACETSGSITGVSAVVAGDNRLAISWTENGSASYVIERSRTPGGPHTRVGQAVTSPFIDTAVSGGSTYYYVVRENCDTSVPSNEASATATGVCTDLPVFAGLQTVTDPLLAGACTADLSWTAATAACGGSISYDVHRSRDAGFTPSDSNKIARGVTGTSFADSANLQSGIAYHYVVRAVEQFTETNTDTNTVERSVTLSTCTSNLPPPGPAVRFAADAFPTTVSAGVAANVVVRALDAVDLEATSYIGTANVTVTDGSATAATTVDFVAGVATLTVTFRTLGSQDVTVTDSGNPSFTASVSTTVVVGPPAQLAFLVQPSNAASSANLSPAIEVGLRNALGDPTTSTAQVTLTLEPASAAGAALAGTTSVAAVSGTASFASVSIAKAGIGYRIVASSPGLPTVTSDPFDITPGTPAALRFDAQPSGSVSLGTPFPLTTVSIVDAAGNRVTGDTSSVTMTSSVGTLQGTLIRSAVAGAASFPDLSFTQTVSGLTLTASATGLTSATSTAFDVTPGPGAALVFKTPSTTLVAGAAASTIEVELRDAQGYLRTNDSTTVVTLALVTHPTDGAITGAATARATNGVATFSATSFRKAGAYVLSASAAGHSETSGFALTVNAGPLARFEITMPASARPGEPITVNVRALDTYDNVATGYQGTATLTATDASAATPSSIRFVDGVAEPFTVIFTGDTLATLTLSDGEVTGAGETVVSLNIPVPEDENDPQSSGQVGSIRGGCSGAPGAESALYGMLLAAAQVVRLRRRPRK